MNMDELEAREKADCHEKIGEIGRNLSLVIEGICRGNLTCKDKIRKLVHRLDNVKMNLMTELDLAEKGEEK